MAFTNVIRKAASRVIPSTTRATGSQRHYHYHHKSLSTAFAPISTTTPQPHLQTTRRQYCHITLLEMIESEIRDKVDVPGGFHFENVNEGEQTVKLAKYDMAIDEDIIVVVQMPSMLSLGCNQSPILMSVGVIRGFLYKRHLVFSLSAYPDKIEITSLSTQIAAASPTQNVSELDENLQKALHNYLDNRGINTQLTNFLHRYIRRKDHKEYVEWLKEVRDFLLW